MSSLSASYLKWRVHFVSNLCRQPVIPWDDPLMLTAAERALVVRSIQQFQLGEGASGRTFTQLAEAESERLRVAELPDAIAVFIQEEQRHSALLARFLLREGESVADRHWVAGSFRWLRKRMGFGFMVAVLSAAEVLAFPYYRALARATPSPILKAICRHILREEVDHLHFQALNLAASTADYPRWTIHALLAMHRSILEAMTLLLWWEHRAVLTTVGGYPAIIRSASKILRNMHRECLEWRQQWEAERSTGHPSGEKRNRVVVFVADPGSLREDAATTANPSREDPFRESETQLHELLPKKQDMRGPSLVNRRQVADPPLGRSKS